MDDIIKECPVSVALKHIGKKWVFHIIRDLFSGSKRFTEFLEMNNNLSHKVLSQRLSEMQQSGLVNKLDSNLYSLSEKGLLLVDVLDTIAEFGVKAYPEEVFTTPPENVDGILEKGRENLIVRPKIRISLE